ncbi:MAG TPA: hypothetical protein VN922_00625, partial [Bacteroidia bacterium]|nr:hypothetical protein [Bacteroidia bacterium]
SQFKLVVPARGSFWNSNVNEFSDWDAALHTFTFSNAVHQRLSNKGVERFKILKNIVVLAYLANFESLLKD